MIKCQILNYSERSTSFLNTIVPKNELGMLSLNTKRVPIIPGIYFFRDKRGQILYIGKAANLRNRISSYFNLQAKDSRISKMLELAARIAWQETDSEIEALILESQLIKNHCPPFNILLRDDKQYFYIGITGEDFPKIFLGHQIQNTKYKILNTKFVGPFTDGNALKTTLRLLRRIFPYCTCKQKHNNYCLNYHIGKCPGFCCLKSVNSKQLMVNRDGYQKNIVAIMDILSGKKNSLVKKLKKEMLEFGKKHEFEKAIELRGKIEKLEKVFENAKIIQNTKYKILNSHRKAIVMGYEYDSLIKLQNVLDLPNPPHRIEGYDISNIQGKFATGAMAVFTDGQPDKNQYRKFKIRLSDESNDIAMLKEVLARRFNHPEWPYPYLIVVDGGKAQLNAVRSVGSMLRHRKIRGLAMTPNLIPVIALTKNKKHRGSHIYVSNKKTAIPLKNLPPAISNLILQIDAEAHRFAINYYRKLHQKLL